jgi:membrane-associated PAP2 superfamily phosphatase
MTELPDARRLTPQFPGASYVPTPEASSLASSRRFWLTHAVFPGVGFAILLTTIASLDMDRWTAHRWYFDSGANRWLGEAENLWWARDILHEGGRWLVRGIAAVALATWIATFVAARLRTWRRNAGFSFLAVALSAGIVGALKAITDVDCPWDLAEFGGDRPYVELFASRPEMLPHAACFPGAHAASGFALVFGYFLLRERAPRGARWAFLTALLVGTAFSFGQEARGAHFLSHDVTSAAIVWFTQLMLYVRILS